MNKNFVPKPSREEGLNRNSPKGESGDALERQRSLDELFDQLKVQRRIFKNKEVLRDSYTPSLMPHRDFQIDELATILISVIRGEAPSNIFIYGKT